MVPRVPRNAEEVIVEPSPHVSRRFERVRCASRANGCRALLVVLSVLHLACSFHEFTTDITAHPRATTAVGRCFALKRDAFVLEAPRRIVIERPKRGEMDVYGVVSVWAGAEKDARQRLKLQAGTHLLVERVLSRTSPMVGDSVSIYLRLDGRFDNRFLDASELFSFTFSKDPVLPVRAYLEACDGARVETSGSR